MSSRIRTFLAGLSATALLAFTQVAPAQSPPQDGYIGPELGAEPVPSKSRSGGWGPGGWQGGWSFCAREGERCSVRGWGVVRYGAQGRYVYREVMNASFRCDNTLFGDPIRGREKACEVRYYQGGNGPGPGSATGWIFCARETAYCPLPGPATVRYGADGLYTFRRFPGGSVHCDNRTFGDPAPRRTKQCHYQPEGWGGGAWSYCASEGQFCSFRGRRQVRYAADDGREVVRSFRNGVECSNRAFGIDPAPRREKRCYVDLR